MTKQELIRLINQEIDGVNSPAESARLQREIDQNLEARQLMDELRGLVGALASTRSLTPPPDLKFAIMREVENQDRRRFHVDSRVRTSWFARTFRKPAYMFVSGLAVGIALIIIYLNVFPQGYVEAPDASGTMLWSTSTFHTGQAVDFKRFGLEGSLETRYGENAGLILLQIGTAGTRAEFRYDANELTLNGVVRGDDFQGSVTLSEGRILAEGNQGTITAFFASRVPTRGVVEVVISSGARTAYRGTLAVHPERVR